MHNPSPNVFRDDGFGNLQIIATNDPEKVLSDNSLKISRYVNKLAGYRCKTYKPAVKTDAEGFEYFEIKPNVKINAEVDRIVVTKVYHNFKVQCMQGNDELWNTMLGEDHIKLLMSAFRGITKNGMLNED